MSAAALVLVAGCAGPRGESQSAPASVHAPAPRDVAVDGPPEHPPADLQALPDAVPKVEPILNGGPNKPYTVLGLSYVPTSADVPWTERGGASWYGNKFHGRRTASGELYSMYGLTAAHRTLPIPSYVRVKNLHNGKSIIVRVNDRGPFHSGRVMDLSYAAAVKLGMVGDGTTQVELSRLTFEDIRTGAWQRGSALDPDPEHAPVAGLLGATQARRGEDTALPVGAQALSGPAAEGLTDPIMDLAARGQAQGEGPTGSGPAVALAPAPVQGDAPRGEIQGEMHGGSQGESQGDPLEGVIRRASGSALQPAVSTLAGTATAYTVAAKGFWVQLAAVRHQDGVDRLQKLVTQRLDALAPMLAVFHEAAGFKLQLGPYRSRDDADATARSVQAALSLRPVVLERR